MGLGGPEDYFHYSYCFQGNKSNEQSPSAIIYITFISFEMIKVITVINRARPTITCITVFKVLKLIKVIEVIFRRVGPARGAAWKVIKVINEGPQRFFSLLSLFSKQ